MTSAACITATTATTTSRVSPRRNPAHAIEAGIVGGSGFTGALLAELLLGHPSVKLTAISSEALVGEPVRRHLPRLRSGLDFCSQADLDGVDVAFLCTPHGGSAPIARRLLDDDVRVIDLSADFRLDPASYAEWYGDHPHPEMLPGVYGLTELNRDEVAGADLVANPGCYPTAALLALAPLADLGLADVVIDAKSGVSGAGKVPTASTHFCSVDSDLVAYGVRSHRHFPEIAAGLARMMPSAGYGPIPGGPGAPAVPVAAPSLTFVPHLAPLQRGISETIYVRPATLPLPSQDLLAEMYREFYAGETFIEIADAPPQLKDVAGTNCCRLFPQVDERSGRLLVFSAIDNLMKGAAGQAVQNMNVMLGLPEQEGLV